MGEREKSISWKRAAFSSLSINLEIANGEFSEPVASLRPLLLPCSLLFYVESLRVQSAHEYFTGLLLPFHGSGVTRYSKAFGDEKRKQRDTFVVGLRR